MRRTGARVWERAATRCESKFERMIIKRSDARDLANRRPLVREAASGESAGLYDELGAPCCFSSTMTGIGFVSALRSPGTYRRKKSTAS